MPSCFDDSRRWANRSSRFTASPSPFWGGPLRGMKGVFHTSFHGNPSDQMPPIKHIYVSRLSDGGPTKNGRRLNCHEFPFPHIGRRFHDSRPYRNWETEIQRLIATCLAVLGELQGHFLQSLEIQLAAAQERNFIHLHKAIFVRQVNIRQTRIGHLPQQFPLGDG